MFAAAAFDAVMVDSCWEVAWPFAPDIRALASDDYCYFHFEARLESKYVAWEIDLPLERLLPWVISCQLSWPWESVHLSRLPRNLLLPNRVECQEHLLSMLALSF